MAPLGEPMLLRQGEETCRARLLAFGLSAVAVLLPLFFLNFPIGTDVPQHLCQVRLLNDWLAGHLENAYEHQSATPYGLIFYLALPVWRFASAIETGFILQAALGLLWSSSFHYLAFRYRLTSAGATVATALFYSCSFYWGFLPFLLGTPLLVGWVIAVLDEAPSAIQDAAALCMLSILLCYTHILHYFAALAILGVVSVVRRDLPAFFRRMLASSLPLLLIVYWYPNLSQRSMGTAAVYLETPTARLSVSKISDAAFGGVHGVMETACVVAILLWIIGSLVDPLKRKRTKRDLGLVAGVLIVLYLVLPNKQNNAVFLNSRWLAPGLAILLVALPPPFRALRTQRLTSFAFLASFMFATTLAQVSFERTQRGGLSAAIDALPKNSRVLGLDYVKTNEILRGRPNLHAAAYAQAIKGGSTNFSFAVFAPFPVVYKPTHARPWTPILEWYPELLSPTDLQYFDYAIIAADDELHEQIPRRWPLAERTTSARFRLYQVLHGQGT